MWSMFSQVMLIMPFRIHFFGDEIEEIEAFDPLKNKTLESYENINIYPANMFCDPSRYSTKCHSSNSR